MIQDEEYTPVVFRKNRGRPPIVTAIFPCEPADVYGRSMSCFEHVGQHSGCSMSWYHTTRKAKPEEYADLVRELEQGYGYRLKVYNKITRQLRDAFNAEVSRLNRRAIELEPRP